MSDEQDYKDYQDYQEYQKYKSSQQPQNQAPQQGPGSKLGNFLSTGMDPVAGTVAKFLGSRFDSNLQKQNQNEQLRQQASKDYPGPGMKYLDDPKYASLASDAKDIIGGVAGGALSAPGVKVSQPQAGAAGPTGAVATPSLSEAGTQPFVSKLKGFLKPAASRADAKDVMKDVASSGDVASDEIKAGEKSYDANTIAPRMIQQAQLAEGKTVRMKPADFMGHSPAADSILQRHLDQARAQAVYGTPQEVDVPLSDALEVRAKLNEASWFKPGVVYDNAAAAQNEAARKAGDGVRAVIASHPEVGEEISGLSDDLQKAYNLKQDVLSYADSKPLQTMISSNADDAAKLAKFDKLAGTNFTQTGIARDQARNALGQSRSWNALAHPIKSIGKGANAAYDAGAQAIHNNIDPNSGDTATKLYYLLRGQGDK